MLADVNIIATTFLHKYQSWLFQKRVTEIEEIVN